jgi:hypothetical protein
VLIATSTAAAPGDRRGRAARRVDALADLADRLLTHGHLDLRAWLGHRLPDPTHTDQPASASSAGIPAEGTHSSTTDGAGTRQAATPT